jgi:RNA polymerase sigma-70 factor (ECF subfamily)
MKGDLGDLGDEQLMLLVQDGDTRAFEALYDRHSRAAFSLVMRVVGSRSTAEDVCQEAFLAVWRSRMRYRPELGSVRSWTLGIVHHRAVDALRRGLVHERRRAPEEPAAERLAARERTDVEAARREEGHAVRSALAELPEDQVRVIELAYFGGLTISQIAEHLDVPIGTIKGRMRLGLTKLRRALVAQGVTPS